MAICESCQQKRQNRFDLKEFRAKNFATDEVKTERLEICKGCEFNKYMALCKKCGCVLKLKASLQNAKCPIGKW